MATTPALTISELAQSIASQLTLAIEELYSKTESNSLQINQLRYEFTTLSANLSKTLTDEIFAKVSSRFDTEVKNSIGDIYARLDSSDHGFDQIKRITDQLTLELSALAAKWEAEHEAPIPLPLPIPIPTPVPTPDPIPSSPGFDLILAYGMTDGFEVVGPVDKTSTVLPAGVKLRIFLANTVRTSIPSAAGLSVGDYLDPLVEVENLGAGMPGWVEFSNSVAASVSFSWNGKNIFCSRDAMSGKFLPFYTEIKGSGILNAHRLVDNVTNYGKMVPLYVALLREHGIEPLKQAIYNYNPDVNQWAQYGCSFKQLVLDGAIAAPCLFGFDRSSAPPVSYLQGIESQLRSGNLPPNSWCYAWDEGYPQDKSAILARVKYISENAPSLSIMITYLFDQDLAQYVDSFCPVLDWFNQPGRPPQSSYPSYGLYTSCMANGNCQNKTSGSQVAAASGTPMMVLDAPRVHQRAFPVMVKALGGKYALYFKADQKLATAFSDQYSEGGNGDGTLLYPGINGPLSSLRLKYIRKGIYDSAFLKTGGFSPISSPFSWSKLQADYDKIRLQYAKEAGWI